MDLFPALFGSPAGFILCPCGVVVENTKDARNAHICQSAPVPEELGG
jgi:hypothetical protein